MNVEARRGRACVEATLDFYGRDALPVRVAVNVALGLPADAVTPAGNPWVAAARRHCPTDRTEITLR